MSTFHSTLMSSPLAALISAEARKAFEDFTTDEQKQTVDRLLSFIRQLRDGTDEQRKAIGVPWDENKSSENELNVGLVLDLCYWQLSQFFRYSDPTRIGEAVPYLKLVIEQFDKVHKGSKGDVTPLLYLGVALQKSGQNDQEALKVFKDGFRYHENSGGQAGPNTLLWAQGSMSRLLRKLGRVSEAEEVENAIRLWLKWHPYGMPPSKFRGLVLDPTHTGKDYILDDPDVEKFFGTTRELP